MKVSAKAALMAGTKPGGPRLPTRLCRARSRVATCAERGGARRGSGPRRGGRRPRRRRRGIGVACSGSTRRQRTAGGSRGAHLDRQSLADDRVEGWPSEIEERHAEVGEVVDAHHRGHVGLQQQFGHHLNRHQNIWPEQRHRRQEVDGAEGARTGDGEGIHGVGCLLGPPLVGLARRARRLVRRGVGHGPPRRRRHRTAGGGRGEEENSAAHVGKI